jgi:beta-glucosidase
MFRKLLPLFIFLTLALSSLAQSTQLSSADVEVRVDSLVKQLTPEEKIDLIGGVDDFYVRAMPKIGLPRLKMSDGPVGVRNYGPATAFGGIGLAATWDPEMARRVGEFIGQDARARGVHFMLGPGVNIYRAPQNGRNFEYFGEDPFLAARTAVAYIVGMQSQGVSATIKHYLANNSEFDRHNTDSVVDERTLREIYLPAFEAAVKEAHVGAIMDSYNLINGLHATQNGYFNNDIAKKEWGFQGIMMSDWGSTYDAIGAANGGLDLEMPSGKFMNRANLIPAIRAGKVSEATIDDKVRRILRVAIQFGWLDREQLDTSIPLVNDSGDKVALEAARAGMVLLKNTGNLLPLDKTRLKTIAVIGPAVYPALPVGGGSAEVKPFRSVSELEGIRNELPNVKVLYEPGIASLDQLAEHTQFATAAKDGKPGVSVEFFNNLGCTGAPFATRTYKHVQYTPAKNGEEVDAAVCTKWKGYFTPTSTGRYLVSLQGPGENGGYRLYVDKNLVFDDWTQWRAFVSQEEMQFTPGPHEIEVDYYVHNGWGKTRLNLGITRFDELVSPEAKATAAKVDAVVLGVGFNADIEGESGDREFRLPPGQDQLIREIVGANKNTVLVINSGGGVDMRNWVDQVPAIFEAWYPGQEGGTALAQLLFGDENPSGKLPVSFERRWQDNPVYANYYPAEDSKKVVYKEGLFVGYRHYDKSQKKPQFPFGFGLSYTTFAYKNLKVSPESGSADQPVQVSFDLTNTGSRPGAEIAQVYVGDQHSSVPRPIKELKGFSKVLLNPGESKTVNLTLDRRAFSYYDVKSKNWVVDPGEFDISVGRSSAEIELTGKVTLK